jgi:hypothetical protein
LSLLPHRLIELSDNLVSSETIPMPAKAAKVPVRAKRTKTEIQREFDEIQEQSADARESSDPKIEEATRRHESEVREAVDGVTVESAVQRISGWASKYRGRCLACQAS